MCRSTIPRRSSGTPQKGELMAYSQTFTARLAMSLTVLLSACSSHSNPPMVAPENNQIISGASAARADATTVVSRLYVTNVNNFGNSVTEYAAYATGNVRPVATIGGSNTHLNEPDAIALDKVGNIYVGNFGGNSITEYPAGSDGNVTPTKTITCGGMEGPQSVSFDVDGNFYVASQNAKLVSVFKPSDTGCVSGNRRIHGSNTQMALDSVLVVSGDTLFVVKEFPAQILEFPRKAAGNVAPSAVITPVLPSGSQAGDFAGIAVDSTGTLYCSDIDNDAIWAFAAGASGSVTPIRAIYATTGTSQTQITYPHGMAIFGQRIAVANSIFTAGKLITEYPLTANGNVAPTHVIQGSLTAMHQPWGLAVK